MASNEKWKSVSVDIKTYKQLKKIAVDEDRKVGQQITNLVKKEYESRYGSEIKDMGIGSAKQMQ
jgi:hypothetical protein|tara:strand:+ start:1200 stop:1391 length:192 start_codon:yes stop_codon:yes gene_type:complete